jgi:hypothetical protein
MPYLDPTVYVLHIVITRIKYMVYGARGGEPVMYWIRCCLPKGPFDGKMLSSEVETDLLQMEGDESTLRPLVRRSIMAKLPAVMSGPHHHLHSHARS